MDLFGKKKAKQPQMNEKNTEAFQSALDDAEQSLEGDELQEAVRQQKGEPKQKGLTQF